MCDNRATGKEILNRSRYTRLGKARASVLLVRSHFYIKKRFRTCNFVRPKVHTLRLPAKDRGAVFLSDSLNPTVDTRGTRHGDSGTGLLCRNVNDRSDLEATRSTTSVCNSQPPSLHTVEKRHAVVDRAKCRSFFLFYHKYISLVALGPLERQKPYCPCAP